MATKNWRPNFGQLPNFLGSDNFFNFKIVKLMATINQITKTFQVVLKYFGLPENFGCQLMVATLMIEIWFSLPEKNRAEKKIG
jgi:hypothetical protein